MYSTIILNVHIAVPWISSNGLDFIMKRREICLFGSTEMDYNVTIQAGEKVTFVNLLFIVKQMQFYFNGYSEITLWNKKISVTDA